MMIMMMVAKDLVSLEAPALVVSGGSIVGSILEHTTAICGLTLLSVNTFFQAFLARYCCGSYVLRMTSLMLLLVCTTDHSLPAGCKSFDGLVQRTWSWLACK